LGDLGPFFKPAVIILFSIPQSGPLKGHFAGDNGAVLRALCLIEINIVQKQQPKQKYLIFGK
jgi:hypothetical protein